MDGATAGTLATILTGDMISGVLSQVVEILPVVIPVTIGFIGIRKGISFLLGMLRAA